MSKFSVIISLLFVVMVLPAQRVAEGAVRLEPHHAVSRKAFTLQKLYDDWRAAHKARGDDGQFVLALGWSKGLSAEFTQAKGIARFDLVGHSLSIKVRGLAEDVSDVWLIDNLPGDGRSVMPEQGDRMLRVGRLRRDGDLAQLHATLDPQVVHGFSVDLVVVTRDGERPETGGVLFGTPTLFQRLVHRGSPLKSEVSAAGVDSGPMAARQARPGVSLVAEKSSTAFTTKADTEELDALIKRGEDLFFNERFEGNGRTCGTCHRQNRNMTIDPEFIATLPDDDPLFVAEFTPALNFDLNGGLRFENPVLMRQAGLIVENVDGTDDLAHKFTMRGVPHILGLRFSLAPGSNDGTTQPPFQRTGWSGDGAPGGGTLRDFATGAVTQHFPKTLNRQPGVDFRLPNDEELDALEAFQLTLGRPAELDLAAMDFADSDVVAGKNLFLGSAKCNICHTNGGANFINAPNENRNFNTGVENVPSPFALLGQPIPRDGGFGQTPNGDGFGGFGNGTFNVPSIIEAGDTPPHFHNNVTDDLDVSVAFYSSDEFNNSPGGAFVGGISMDPTEQFQVTALVYVLNVLENIRKTNELLEDALNSHRRRELQKSLNLAVAESKDAFESMEDAKVQKEVLNTLMDAHRHIVKAVDARGRKHKFKQVHKAFELLDEAREALLVDDDDSA